jgi:drug/metabolite transporter (DMT)-like permease
MLLGSFSFSWMAALAHLAGESCDWQVIAFARSFLAMLLAAGLAWSCGASLRGWTSGILWIRSLAGSISMVCTFAAFTRLPVSDVLTLTNTFPIWVALLSWPLEGEAPAPAVWLSVASGVVGVCLIQQPDGESNYATLLALTAAFFSAIAMLGLNRVRDVQPSAIVVHFSAVSLLFITTSFFVFDRHHSLIEQLQGQRLWVLAGVGVTATVGQLFLTRAFTTGDPTRVSVVGLTQVAFALFLDVAFLKHTIKPLTVLGMILTLAPTAWLMLRQMRSVPRDLAADEEEPVVVTKPSRGRLTSEKAAATGS